MKKLLLLLTLLLSLTLVGCSSDDYESPRSSHDDDEEVSSSSKSKRDSEEEDDYIVDTDRDDKLRDKDSKIKDKADSDEEDEESDVNESDAPLLPGEYKLSSPRMLTLPQIGSFEITSYIISESYGDKIITLRGNYTNSLEDSDWSLSIFNNYFDVYQDDILLNSAVSDNDIDKYTQIKPGKTIEASCSYTLRTETDDIEIIGEDYNRVEYTVTFPIK